MAIVEPSIEHVKPTYFGFLNSHFAIKIGETIDPYIMQRRALGRKRFVELVIVIQKGKPVRFLA